MDRDSHRLLNSNTLIDIRVKKAMNNALDTLGKHLSLTIFILEHLQQLAVHSQGISDLRLLKSIVVSSATNA
jgi:hypothetical protein